MFLPSQAELGCKVDLKALEDPAPPAAPAANRYLRDMVLPSSGFPNSFLMLLLQR